MGLIMQPGVLQHRLLTDGTSSFRAMVNSWSSNGNLKIYLLLHFIYFTCRIH